MKDKKDNPIYNQYTDFVRNNLSKPSYAKLTETKLITEFNEEIAYLLAAFYDNSTDGHVLRMASVMNAVYAQQNNVFLIATDSLNDLVKNDPNHDLKSCNSETYTEIMNRFFSRQILKEVRKAVRRAPGVKGRAGLYELIHPDLLNPLIKMVGQDMCRAKKEAFIKWWDETASEDDKVDVKPKLPKTELELELERRAYERKLRKRT